MKVERRSYAALAAAGILVLSVAIVAMVAPLLKTLSLPSVALGGSSPQPATGELVVSAELISPRGLAGLSGVTFLISSAAGPVSFDYVTNASGVFVASLPFGRYTLRTADPRFSAQASFSILPGNITIYHMRVTQTDSHPSFYDAVDSDASGFLDSTESLFVTIPRGDIALNASAGVTITYLSDVFITVTSGLTSNSIFIPSTVSSPATVLSSDPVYDTLHLVLSPSSAVPLQGLILLSVSTYTVFDEVTYRGVS